MLETTWLTAYAYKKRLRISISNHTPVERLRLYDSMLRIRFPILPIPRLKHLLLFRKRHPSVHMVPSRDSYGLQLRNEYAINIGNDIQKMRWDTRYIRYNRMPLGSHILKISY